MLLWGNKNVLETAHVTIASADCTNIVSHNHLLWSAQGVRSFPTLNIYRDGMLGDLAQFVEKQRDIWKTDMNIAERKIEL